MVQTGTYISGIAHVALISWTIIGGAFSSTPKPPEVQVAEVSIITETAFSALNSNAPELSVDIQPPQLAFDTPEAPLTPQADTLPVIADVEHPKDPETPGPPPDLSNLTEVPQTSAQVDAPDSPEQPGSEELGLTLNTPTEPIGLNDSAGREAPDRLAILLPAEQPAPRVDTKAAPKPETDAEVADEVEKATTAGDAASQDAEEVLTEKAPLQASTEIITEAKQQPRSAAPIRSSRPRGRPQRLGKTSTAAEDIANAVARAQAEAATAPRPTPVQTARPSGPPLTRGEKEGLRLAVQKCWNVGSLSSDALRVTVVVGVSLGADGRPQPGTVTLISSSDGSNVAAKQAFEAARRAIIRCGAKGFDLPKEKYDTWRNVEMTFNPDKMRIK